MLPAVLIVTALAWAYVRFGSLPEAGSALYGIKPVIIAVILQALWDLKRKAVKGTLTATVGLAVLALYFLGINEIALLFAGGLAVMVGENLRRFGRGGALGSLMLFAGSSSPAAAVAPFSMPVLFLIFL